MELLNEDECQKIVNRIVSSGAAATATARKAVLAKVDFTHSSGETEGYLGKYFNIKITYHLDQDDRQDVVRELFAKKEMESLKTDPDSGVLSLFNNELIFFADVLADCDRLGIDTSFAPKCFYSENELIVLDDLTKQGYTLTKKMSFFNEEQIDAVLKSLSAFHAAGLVLERKRSVESGKDSSLVDLYPKIFDKRNGDFLEMSYQPWLTSVATALSQIVRDKNGFGAEPGEFVEKLQTLARDYWKRLKHGDAKRTFVHFDLWSNNLFLRKSELNPMDCVIIDYQFVRYGIPAVDVLSFLYTNTNLDFRKPRMKMFLNKYYQYLNEKLTNYNPDLADLITKEEFLKSCKQEAVVAKYRAFLDRCFLMLSEDTLRKCAKDEEYYQSVLLSTDGKVILDWYRDSPKFRQVINEDLEEMQQILWNSFPFE